MADIYDTTKRAEIMSKISGKDTKPEMMVRKYLFANGFRFRKNDKRFSGKPDVVLPKYKTVIFIHGCFWHGHMCKAAKLPTTRQEFWQDKISNNIARDRRNVSDLELTGWKVITVWQCEIKTILSREKRLKELINQIRN